MAKAKPTTAKPPKAKPAAVPAPAPFQATCPTCGMTADVTADVEAVRCRRCGTIVQLVDDGPDLPAAPVPVAALPPPVRASILAKPGLAVAVGLLGPLLVLVAYGTAHTAVDQPQPDTGTAGVWYMVALLIAAATVFSLWLAFVPGQVFPRALWSLFAAVPMFLVAQAAGTEYADDGVVWAIIGLPFLGVYLIAIGIIASVLANRQDGSGPAAVLVGGVGICAGLGVSALYMLMTLQRQADAAREAHEAPAWGVLVVLGVLLTMAALCRRTS